MTLCTCICNNIVTLFKLQLDLKLLQTIFLQWEYMHLQIHNVKQRCYTMLFYSIEYDINFFKRARLFNEKKSI